jgi:hypothetical protein
MHASALHSQAKNTDPFNKGLVRHQSWPERFGKEKGSSFAGNRTPDRPARKVVTVPNKMHRLSFLHVHMLTYTTVCEEENLWNSFVWRCILTQLSSGLCKNYVCVCVRERERQRERERESSDHWSGNALYFYSGYIFIILYKKFLELYTGINHYHLSPNPFQRTIP